MNTFRAQLAFSFCFAASGCDCGDDIKLEIVEPLDAAAFNAADDVDDGQAGVQVIVRVATEGLSLNGEVGLTVNGLEVEDAARVGTGGLASFQAVTISDGENVLVARAEGVESDPVIVTLEATTDQCPELSISRPDSDSLTGEDDEDDEPCGEFHYTVVAATSAQSGRGATLFVNGNQIMDATVEGAEIRFENATLDAGSNDIEVRLDGEGDCSAAFTTTVDCGVTCTVSEPTGDVLNAEDDLSDPPAGLQVNVEVATDAEDGQTVDLLVDDAEVASESVDSGVAAFGEVSLAEGDRELQAVCRDAAGNEVRSARVRFLVDTVAPGVAITQPETRIFGLDDDADPDADGLQVEVCASSTEDGEFCASIEGAAPGADGCEGVDSGDEACGMVDCSGAVDLEAAVTDEAGNEGTTSISVTCYAGVPVVRVLDPQDDQVLLVADDLAPGSPGMQYDVVVCSDTIGGTATLFVGGSSRGTEEVVEEDCDDLQGTARFSSVALDEGFDVVISAEVRSAGGNTGTSPEVWVDVDSIPPDVIWVDPLCNSLLSPQDDIDGDIDNGIQYDVRVRLPEIPGDARVAGDVVWEAGGGEPFEANGLVPPGWATFPSVTFRQGDNTLTISLEDPAGNPATEQCNVRASEGGLIEITSPAENAVFTAGGDGDPGTPGYQGALVHVSADGPTDGSMQVCVDDGVGNLLGCVSYDSAGGVDVPVTLPEGAAANDAVTLTARTVDHPDLELASVPRAIRVDTLLPETPPAITTAVQDARAGSVRLTFTAPADPVGRTVAGYQVRWSATPFADESSGTLISAVGAPAAPATEQTLDITGLSPGAGYYVAVRARDSVGNTGASRSDGFVTISFALDTIDSPVATANFGFSGYGAAGGASVNGDQYDDLLVSTLEGSARAYLYFGGPAGLSSTPDVTFQSVGAPAFGTGVAMLEDFNGDDVGDVAIGDYLGNGQQGIVYVFFGSDSMPAVLTPAVADITITNDMPAPDFIGLTMSTAGDFNGDGLSDLLIGAFGYNSFAGEAYLVLGRDPNEPGEDDIVLPGDRDLEITGVIDGGFLFKVAPAGDVDGDGRDDIIVGTCRNALPGEVYVFHGEADAQIALARERRADLGIVLSGGLGFGCGLGGVGDVDGDGNGDVVVGAPWVAGPDIDVGNFALYLGDGTGDFEDPLVFTNLNGPNVTGDQLGNSVAATVGLEDETPPSINPGTTPDIAVAQVQHSTGPGRAVLYWGAAGIAAGDVAGAPASVFLPEGANAALLVGYAGDVNDDGHVDLFVGDPYGLVDDVAAGRLYLLR